MVLGNQLAVVGELALDECGVVSRVALAPRWRAPHRPGIAGAAPLPGGGPDGEGPHLEGGVALAQAQRDRPLRPLSAPPNNRASSPSARDGTSTDWPSRSTETPARSRTARR